MNCQKESLTGHLGLPLGVSGLIFLQTHGGVIQVLVLVALVGQAEGGVLSFKNVQIAHLIAAVADGEGDGKGVIQQERLGLGKGGIPGVHVVGDGRPQAE